MPLLTLATITLNNAQGIEKTKKSIKKQSFKDFEWLVQDGASTDETLNILKNTSAKLESKGDKGIYDAMNRLIERSTGDHILFLNAGDQLAAANTLQEIAEHLQKDTPDLLYGDALEEHKGSEYLKSARSHQHLQLGMFTHHQSMIYRRAAIGNLRYNIDYEIAADYDFTARFIQNAKIIEYIKTPICIFETGGISQQRTALGRKEQFQIREELKLCDPIQNHIVTLLQILNMALRNHFPSLFWTLKRH